MRVLVAHNRYRSANPSGENQVVDREIEALRRRGVQVVEYLRSSDELAGLSAPARAGAAVLPVHARKAQAELRRLITEHRPDVLHLHNAYPLISPSAVRTARRAGVPVVHTVHNHRHVCMAGTYFRNGALCTQCAGPAGALPGVVHGCYQGSRLRSVPMAVTLQVHHGRPGVLRGLGALASWDLVDRFLALTPQLAGHLEREAGVDPDRIVVRPNTVEDPPLPVIPAPSDGPTLFVGRLSDEKGIPLLLDAWSSRPDTSMGRLVLVGDGDLRPLVEQAAARRTDIEVRGAQSPTAVLRAMDEAAVVVIPSTCPDVFPLVALEAMARGRALVGTDLGGLPGIVAPEVGCVVPPTVPGLLDGLADARGRARTAGAAARARYLQHYHPDVVMDQLLDVYASVALRH